MDGWLYAGYTLVHIGFAALLGTLWRRKPTFGLFGVGLIVVGLIYDNAIVALGSTIGAGSTLESLNWLRFGLHALCTPLLCIYGLDAVGRAGVMWAKQLRVRSTIWLVTIGLIALGVVAEYGALQLQPSLHNGVTRYVAAEQHGPPLAAIGANVVLLVFGGVLWRRCGWRTLFAGALAMFVGSGVAGGLQSAVLGSGFEVVLIGSLLLTERWLQARTATAEATEIVPVEQSAVTT